MIYLYVTLILILSKSIFISLGYHLKLRKNILLSERSKYNNYNLKKIILFQYN